MSSTSGFIFVLTFSLSLQTLTSPLWFPPVRLPIIDYPLPCAYLQSASPFVLCQFVSSRLSPSPASQPSSSQVAHLFCCCFSSRSVLWVCLILLVSDCFFSFYPPWQLLLSVNFVVIYPEMSCESLALCQVRYNFLLTTTLTEPIKGTKCFLICQDLFFKTHIGMQCGNPPTVKHVCVTVYMPIT